MNKIVTILLILIMLVNLAFAVKVIEDFSFGEETTVPDEPVVDPNDTPEGLVVCAEDSSGLMIDGGAYPDSDDGSCIAPKSILEIDEDAYKVPDCENEEVPNEEGTGCKLPEKTPVVSFIKLINKKIVENKFNFGFAWIENGSKGDAAAIVTANKAKGSAESDMGFINTDSTRTRLSNSITWTGLRSGGDATIGVPYATLFSGDKSTLTVTYYHNNWTNIEYIYVFVNGQQVRCKSAWGGVINAQFTAMILGWGETQESCSAYSVDGVDVLSVKLQSVGGNTEMILTSPLIPDIFNGKSFNAAKGDEHGILLASC